MFRHHEPKALPPVSGRQKEDVQMRRLLPLPFPEKRPDFPGPGHPTRRRQSESARRPRCRVRQNQRPYLEPTLTTSRRRPFWRRRFRVLRPPFVFIRARNPCLFFLFRFRGLYVGIMISHPLATWLHFKISSQRYQTCPGTVNPGSPFLGWVSPVLSYLRLTFPHSGNSLLPPISGSCLLRRWLPALPRRGPVWSGVRTHKTH